MSALIALGGMAMAGLLFAEMPATRPADIARLEIDPTTAPVRPPSDIIDPLTQEQYATQYAAALQLIGPAASNTPMTGASITSVEPDSPAAIASLHVNDVIVAIDKTPTPTADAARGARRAPTTQQTFDILPCDQPTHRLVKVDPGHLGIEIDDAWILEGQYIHSLPAGVLPVDEVRVAARYAAIDPALAESALAHAKKAGGPGTAGPAVDAIAATALYNDCWFESALSYAIAASNTLPIDQRAQMDRIIIDSAIATFRFPLANATAALDSRYAWVPPTTDVEMAAFGDHEHTLLEANPAASEIEFVDHTQDAINTAPHANGEFESSKYRIWFMQNKRTIPFTSPDGSYNVCRCGPGDSNVDFSADCHFTATDNGTSGYVKVVRVGVEIGHHTFQTLEINLNGIADVVSNVGKSAPTLNIKHLVEGDRNFKLRMTIVGDRYEFDIDGRRIFYGPLSSTPAVGERQLNLSIQTVGVKGQFSNVSWKTAAPN